MADQPPTDDQPPTPDSSSSENAPNVADLEGTVLAGRYRITKRLGAGGMGAVYLGEHLRVGRKDAIKVLRAEKAQEPEAIARFTRGARAVARIHHPNVCELYDFGETEDGLLFLAMEFIEGPSLGKLLTEEGRLDPERAIRFIQQAGEALHAAHESGVIHRDLKPDNLMVAVGQDGSEQLKVVDFDIARRTEQEGAGVTRQGFVVGTPEYMSPEQFTGDSLDARSDIYSLALVLFRCLSGRLPFEGTTAQQLMMERLTVEPLRLSQAAPGHTFPPGLEAILHQALSSRRDDRPDSAREFVQQVISTIEHTPVRPPTPPTSPDEAAPMPLAEQRVPATIDVSGRAARTAPGPGVPKPPPEAIPGTRAAARAGATSGEARAWASQHGSLVVVGAGAGMGLLALIVAGWLLVFPGAESTDTDDTRVTSSSVSVVESDDEPTPPAPEDGTRDPPADAGAGATVERSESHATGDPGGGVQEDAPPVTSEAEATPPPPVAGAQRVALPQGDPRPLQDLTFDQFVLQAEATGPADIRAARDTAAAVWAAPGATRADRAFAAHVLGLTLVSLGDSIQGVDWLQEAVTLDPLDRYIRVLELYRRPGR